MCKVKNFIFDPVLVTKKLRPLQAKIKYQSAQYKSLLHEISSLQLSKLSNLFQLNHITIF